MNLDDEDWGEPQRIPPLRFIPLDVVMYGLDWVSNVLEATDEFVGGVQQLLGGHINHIRDRDRFAATAGLEIEALTSAPEEDA